MYVVELCLLSGAVMAMTAGAGAKLSSSTCSKVEPTLTQKKFQRYIPAADVSLASQSYRSSNFWAAYFEDDIHYSASD